MQTKTRLQVHIIDEKIKKLGLKGVGFWLRHDLATVQSYLGLVFQIFLDLVQPLSDPDPARETDLYANP